MNRWIMDHAQALKDAWKRTANRSTQFIVLMLLLGVLLAIPGWLTQIWLAMVSLVPEHAVQSETIVFLKENLELEERIDLERVIREKVGIKQVLFVSKSEALNQLSSKDGLALISDLQRNNPLPDALRVRFSVQGSESQEKGIVSALSQDVRVLSLRYYPSSRIQYASLLEMLGVLGIGLSMLTVLGVLMTVFLVAAADVVDDRRRIELYTLLGASNGFIRRPYLYRSTFLGLLAGFIACLVITLLNNVLLSMFQSNLLVLDTRLTNIAVDGRIFIGIEFIAMVASWIGAERAISRQLKSLH